MTKLWTMGVSLTGDAGEAGGAGGVGEAGEAEGGFAGEDKDEDVAGGR